MNDKAQHIAAGAAIAGTVKGLGVSCPQALLASALAGVSKELWDSAGHGTPDVWDAVATVAGGVMIMAVLAGCSHFFPPPPVATPMESVRFTEPPYPYRLYGFTPQQETVVLDAVASISERVKPVGPNLDIYAATHLENDAAGNWNGKYIQIQRDIQSKELWLVTAHELLHSLGYQHAPQAPYHLMSPVIHIDKLNPAGLPEAEDLAYR